VYNFRYGQPAGNLASGTFDTVGNVFVVSQNVNYITPKGIAKKMVKRTGVLKTIYINNNILRK